MKEKLPPHDKYEILALQLQTHLKYYIPTGWVKTIGNVKTISISKEQAQNFETFFKNKTLKKNLKYFNNGYFNTPAIIEGLKSFFEKNKK